MPISRKEDQALRDKETRVDHYIDHNAGSVETADLNITENASVETCHVLVPLLYSARSGVNVSLMMNNELVFYCVLSK